MKHRSILTALLLVVLTSAMAQSERSTVADTAQVDNVAPVKKAWPSFLGKHNLPDGSKYLPAPPAFGSEQFVGDMVWYHWGKSLRDTPRGEQAKHDAEMNVESMMRLFSVPFGMELSEEKTPEMYDFLARVMTDATASTSKAKKHFKRLRPFLYFNEGTLVPEEEASHHTPSYPSSHSAAGWGVALVLSELNTDSAEVILKTGYEYGQSRVIAGYHYQSDVDAARMAASACIVRLHADENFMKQLKKVRKELDKLRKQ